MMQTKKMPYKIRKLPSSHLYRVYKTDMFGKMVDIRAYGTTLEKAKAMVRLLHAVDHGWKPNGIPKNKKSSRNH